MTLNKIDINSKISAKDHVLSFDDIDQLEKILEMKKSFAVEEVDCNCPEEQCECHLHHH